MADDCRHKPASRWRWEDSASRAPARRRRTRGGLALAALLAVGLNHGEPVSASTSASASGQMRSARYALALGQKNDAAEALAAVVAEAPRSSAGIEAALLLAELHFTDGHPSEADAVLAQAQQAAPGGEVVHLLGLARGWMALGRNDGAAASDHCANSGATGIEQARDLASLGAAWGALLENRQPTRNVRLELLARRGWHPALRLAAAFTCAHAAKAQGDFVSGLRVLRSASRTLRDTPFEDDIELALALAHLDAGQLSSAQKARARLARLARQSDSSQASGAPSLTFEELRAGPAQIVRRASELYAERGSSLQGFSSFAARLLDRAATSDLGALDALIETASARSSKEGSDDAKNS